MTITRIGITEPAGGLPIISRVVRHAGLVYLCGVTPEPGGDIRMQTREVLARIDRLLTGAGTDKSKLITAQIWLTDMKDFAAMKEVWNAWVDPKQPPVRACVQSPLYRAGLLVEIMVTAAE